MEGWREEPTFERASSGLGYVGDAGGVELGL